MIANVVAQGCQW